MIEPSDTERSEWPTMTTEYVEELEERLKGMTKAIGGATNALRRERDSLVNPKARRLGLAEIQALIAELEEVK